MSDTAERPKTRVIMYHHTHWDREWWTSFETFRFRLVYTVDKLLEILERDSRFTTFVLDGQTIALKDYLEIRPERREELLGHIRSGRIHVGPWHILPDEFLVSAEATIRNLWLGERMARAYGVSNSRVGYLPDQFGHVGQMPQILNGFGIDSAVVWRGFGAPPLGQPEGTGDVGADQYAYPKARNTLYPQAMQSEFWWEAPDGTRVLGVYLPLEYYRGHYRFDENDPELTRDQTVGRSRRFVEYMRPYAATSTILEPMGGDHLPVDERLPGLLETINRELAAEGIEYRQGSLVEFIEAVKAENPTLGVVWKGEGRAFGRKAHLLPAVLSARLYLKQRNRDCQTLLERYAEPLQALNWMLGGRYENGYLWHAWERLIQNHPHDSICGCSHDQVHREMMTRFAESEQAAGLLAATAAEDLAARSTPAPSPGGAQPVVVWNPLSWSRTDEARVVMNPHLEVSPRDWALLDSSGRELPFQTREVEVPLTVFEPWRWLGFEPTEPRPLRPVNVATEVSFQAQGVPGLGYRGYTLERRAPGEIQNYRRRPYTVAGVVARDKGALETSGLSVGPGLLENEFLRVTVSGQDGSLTLLDKETGLTYPGLNAFRDGGDAGDTYNYSWPLGDQVLETRNLQPRLSWVEVGPVRATLRVTWPWALPEALSEDRDSRSPAYVPLELHSDLTLRPGVKRLDVRTHFVNTASDHRLQALFPLGARVECSSAEGHFHVVDRPVGLPEGERGSAEPAVHEHPQLAFVSVSDGERGLTIANKGLPEFSVADDEAGTIALTVLRAVGWLSREDFLARVGGAGPTVATPDAQMLGRVEAEYSLIPHRGDWETARSYREAHDFNAPLRATPRLPQAWPARPPGPNGPASGLPQDLPTDGQLLAIEGDLLLSALKKAEDREALVVRLVNQGRRDSNAALRPITRPRRAYLVNLKEEPLENGELEIAEDGAVRLEARPWQVVTVAMEF